MATPRDDCPYAKSNANTFVRAHAYGVFLTSCVRINLKDIPSVDPHTLGRKTLYKLASLKYCYNYRWPKKTMVYAPKRPDANPDITELSETESIVADFFADEAKVAELVRFLSLEESKGSDKFNYIRVDMFKRLFRNHGDFVLTHLRTHLEKGHSIYRTSKNCLPLLDPSALTLLENYFVFLPSAKP